MHRMIGWFTAATLSAAIAGCTVVGFDTPYNKGVEAYRAGQLSEAAEHFRTAIDKDPEFFEAWYNLARVYDELAARYRQRAATLADENAIAEGDDEAPIPGVPPAAIDGMTRAEKRDALLKLAGEMLRKAEAAYEATLNAKPDATRALVSYAMFLYEQKQTDRAAQLLLKATRVESDRAYPLVSLGYFYQLEGRREEARAQYEKARLIEPTDVLALYRLGQWHADAGNWEIAQKLFADAIAADPADAPSWKELGIALAKLGQNVQAAQALGKFVELASIDRDTVPMRVAALLLMAELYQAVDRHERAVDALWNARSLAPNNREVAEKLRQSYEALVREETARLIRLAPRRDESANVPPANAGERRVSSAPDANGPSTGENDGNR